MRGLPRRASAASESRTTVWGLAFCLISALAFSGMTIFGKLAYETGLNVPTLLGIRFTSAALCLGVVIALTPRLRGARPSPRVALGALLLAGVVYATQSASLFAALERIDASLAVLLLYAYPAFVAAGSVVLGRERLGGRRTAVLALASLGVALVLGGRGNVSADELGIALGLVAAALYAAAGGRSAPAPDQGWAVGESRRHPQTTQPVRPACSGSAAAQPNARGGGACRTLRARHAPDPASTVAATRRAAAVATRLTALLAHLALLSSLFLFTLPRGPE